MKKSILLCWILLFFSNGLNAQDSNDFDYNSLQAIQSSCGGGFLWTKMSERDKGTYLMGYEDGYLNALGYEVKDKKKRDNLISELPSFYDSENIKRNDLIPKLDKFYEEHAMYIYFPIPLALRLIIYNELGLKSEIDERQVQFYEKELKDVLSKSRSNGLADDDNEKYDAYIAKKYPIESLYNGHKTTYREWTPFYTEIKGERIVLYENIFFLSAYIKELEKEYGEPISDTNIKLIDYDKYFSSRAEKEGDDLLVIDLIRDFLEMNGHLTKK